MTKNIADNRRKADIKENCAHVNEDGKEFIQWTPQAD